MARPIMLGNGALTVGLNEHGLVHDFYYPYVGLDNLTTARSVHHKIGVWVDGHFSWLDDGSWEITIYQEPAAVISSITATSSALSITLQFSDFVAMDDDIFGRVVTAKNNADQKREIRVLFHQVYQISRGGRADTALYVPDDHYILDYKGRCSLLISGQNSQKQGFDQFAIGNYGIEDKRGTFVDAEDGELSGSAVEHGGVDSVIRFSMTLEASATETLEYWVVASDTQFNAQKIHAEIKDKGLYSYLTATRKAWSKWLAKSDTARQNVPKNYIDALNHSLMVIKVHTDKRGGVIASADSSIYNYGRDYYSYVWPRDGALALWPLIRLGYTDEAKRFFEFCRDIITPDGYLMHKYQPDRAIGSTWHPWLHNNRKELPIQEDETAVVLYMIGEYLAYSNDLDFVSSLYDSFIKPAADFVATFTDTDSGLPHASYDLWEERFATHSYTVALSYQALQVACEIAGKLDKSNDATQWQTAISSFEANAHKLIHNDGYIVKSNLYSESDLIMDGTIDVSSLYGAMVFGLFDQSALDTTYAKITEELLTQDIGVPRYQNDNYFRISEHTEPNPWIITTLWLSQYLLRNKKVSEAQQILDWTIGTALPSGVLSEQVKPHSVEQISVSPLVWSHAELANTIIDLSHLK